MSGNGRKRCGDDRCLDKTAVEALIEGRHPDPFAVLGPHETASGTVIRAFLPGASAATVIGLQGNILATFRRTHQDGLFEAALPAAMPYRLRIDWQGVMQETEDPYAFPTLLGQLDVHLLAEGRHRQIGACLGAQPMEVDGIAGVRFAVWAPNARRVSVVGDFNAWDGRRHPMRLAALNVACGRFSSRAFPPANCTNTKFSAPMERSLPQSGSGRARGRGAARHGLCGRRALPLSPGRMRTGSAARPAANGRRTAGDLRSARRVMAAPRGRPVLVLA